MRDLFGEPVAEQVVGRATERGRSQALLELDARIGDALGGLLQDRSKRANALRPHTVPDRGAALGGSIQEPPPAAHA